MPKAKSLHYLFLAIFLPALLFLLLLYNVVPVSANPSKETLETADTTTQIVLDEVHKWEAFLSDNPTYIAGWIRLGDLLSEIGSADYAQGAYTTAHSINPNYLGLERKLGY